MQLPIFKLEDCLSTREFRAPYMFCASDAETYSMKRNNITLLDEFFGEYDRFFQWVRPKGGEY
jgi:hypothetical protein